MSDADARLIRMAEQIVKHLPPGETRADQAADHIRRFWTPKMRQDLLVAVKGRDLDPVLTAALQKI